MGQQPALGIEHLRVLRAHPAGAAVDDPFPRQPRVGQAVGTAAIEQPEIHPCRGKAGCHEIFGKTFDIPRRIAEPGGSKHVVVGIFVQQHFLAEIALGGIGGNAAVAGTIKPRHAGSDPSERHRTVDGVDDIDIQLGRVLVHFGGGELAEQIAIIFQSLHAFAQGIGRHSAINAEMRRFRHAPRRRVCRRTGRSHHQQHEQRQDRAHDLTISKRLRPVKHLPPNSVLFRPGRLPAAQASSGASAPSCLSNQALRSTPPA